MAYWAVARTFTGREGFAAERLNSAGFETFVPATRTDRGAAPLFPGYLFIRVGETWRAIDRTLGVIGVLKFGDAPAKCPDAEILKIRASIGEDGLVLLPTPPAPVRRTVGDRVVIADGPFRGFVAVYAGMSAQERELVLINLLGRAPSLELGPGQAVVGSFEIGTR